MSALENMTVAEKLSTMVGEMTVILLHYRFKTHTNSWKSFHNTLVTTGITVKKIASLLFNFLNQKTFN